jgi:hypothetical protein
MSRSCVYTGLVTSSNRARADNASRIFPTCAFKKHISATDMCKAVQKAAFFILPNLLHLLDRLPHELLDLLVDDLRIEGNALGLEILLEFAHQVTLA